MIRRNPPTSRAILHTKRLIERRLKPIFSRHSQIHLRKLPYRRYDDFRSKRQRGDHNPRGYSAVVRTEWGASSGIVEKLAFDAVNHTLHPTGTIAGCKSPTMFSVTDETH